MHDPQFRGFLRLEYGLWHGQPQAKLAPVADGARPLRARAGDGFPKLTIPPGDLSLRAHEILENTLQFELTGETDEGSHTNLGTAWANVQGTRLALDALHPPSGAPTHRLRASASAGLDGLGAMLAAYRRAGGGWTPLCIADDGAARAVNGATSGLLEQLELIPDMLQPAPSGGEGD